MTPEIRIDQLTGSRVILAPGRSDRPEGMSAPRREVRGSEGCPFCEGHEDKTPPEVWADRPGGGAADSPGWRVRAVPNLYPALAPAADGEGPGEPGGRAGGKAAGSFAGRADPLQASVRGVEADLFGSWPALGAHEVIISAPEHHGSLADLGAEQLAATLAAWRTRIAAHSDAAYTQLIVNEGLAAGASLEHSHAQLYAR